MEIDTVNSQDRECLCSDRNNAFIALLHSRVMQYNTKTMLVRQALNI